jgi:hypothetical protein
MIVAIVDVIERKGHERIFRIIAANRGSDGNYVYRRVQRTETELIEDISMEKYRLINGGMHCGMVKATAGDFSRFNNGVNKPLVIITEMLDHRAITLGYKVANSNGDVASMSLIGVIDYCDKIAAKGGVPIQNGIYVPAQNGQRAFIRCYPSSPYPKEIHARKTSKFAKPTYVDKRQGEQNVSRIEEMFNREQIQQLQLGKKNGMDIRIIGNNKLSADQMRIIRECEEKGLPGRVFADPSYDVRLMGFFQAELYSNADIRPILNPNYTVEQALEISIANELGLDTSELDDPSLSVREMCERRIRLANGMWKKHEVVTDGLWE